MAAGDPVRVDRPISAAVHSSMSKQASDQQTGIQCTTTLHDSVSVAWTLQRMVSMAEAGLPQQMVATMGKPTVPLPLAVHCIAKTADARLTVQSRHGHS